MENKENVIGLLNHYHNDIITQELISKFLTPTIFDIIDKRHSETVHTNFLSWIFNLQFSNLDNTQNPIHGLLRILYRRALEQDRITELGDSETIESIRYASYVSLDNIRVIKVSSEYPCPGVRYKSKKKDNEGRVDILIECILKIKNNIQQEKKENVQIPLKIVIENKLWSNQHDMQTWKYYSYFKGETYDKPDSIEIIEWREKEENEQCIFVLLTPYNPTSVKPDCEHYIRINYQDIMDEILIPIRNSIYLYQRDKVFIEEYIRGLSIPHIDNEKTNIMSLPPEDRILLKEFYEKNKRLIKLTLQALAEGSDDDDSRESAGKMLDALTDYETKRKHFRLVIDNKTVIASGTMRTIQEEIVKHLLLSGVTIVKIKSLFPFWTTGAIYIPEELEHLNPKKMREITGDEKGKNIRYSKITVNDKIYYLRKEWTSDRFSKFREKVENSTFNIQIIDL